jgi:hypothetical protein
LGIFLFINGEENKKEVASAMVKESSIQYITLIFKKGKNVKMDD